MLTLLLMLAASTPAQAPTVASTPCANWAGECPALDPSAPFLRTPRVEALAPCRGTSTEGAKCSTGVWSHTFVGAAFFPIPRFGPEGEPVTADGLVIYEGMKLTVNYTTGHYDLSFTATAPNVPVTVRLQLELSRSGTAAEADSIRLTLPPIVIEPSPAARAGDPAGTTVAINHRGYSAALNRDPKTVLVFTNLLPHARTATHPLVNPEWHVRRLGTARFGLNAPTADDLSR